MIVLGIESSCDDTGLAIYSTEQGLLAHALHSQTAVHQRFGGVVPELASRDHLQRMLPLLQDILKQTNLTLNQLDAVAFTAGPGLVGALLVGACFGRALAWQWGIPAVAVHHMEAHLLAPMLEDQPPAYPFLALLVSGGHTQLVEVLKFAQYRLLGESIDDAAGEAFDKTAKLLGLGYPGGPALAKLAQQGNASAFKFPRPMTDRPGFDFSFSGLKTAVMRTVKKAPLTDQRRADIAASFQQAVVDTLVIKCHRALEATHLPRLVVAGGVSANESLRAQLRKMTQAIGASVYTPRSEFCTDNGAMVAYAGACRLQAGHQCQDLTVTVKPRWRMNN